MILRETQTERQRCRAGGRVSWLCREPHGHVSGFCRSNQRKLSLKEISSKQTTSLTPGSGLCYKYAAPAQCLLCTASALTVQSQPSCFHSSCRWSRQVGPDQNLEGQRSFQAKWGLRNFVLVMTEGSSCGLRCPHCPTKAITRVLGNSHGKWNLKK